jgi:hypothetical protein
MLKTAADFPHAGSFALYVDKALPPSQQRAELVRIQRRYCETGADPRFEMVTVSFPLRGGASGHKVVAFDDLIDGTPLNRDERRQHADLENHLRGRDRLTPRLRAMLVTAEKLRSRAIFSMVLESELAKLRAIESRTDASAGRYVPREAAL